MSCSFHPDRATLQREATALQVLATGLRFSFSKHMMWAMDFLGGGVAAPCLARWALAAQHRLMHTSAGFWSVEHDLCAWAASDEALLVPRKRDLWRNSCFAALCKTRRVLDAIPDVPTFGGKHIQRGTVRALRAHGGF